MFCDALDQLISKNRGSDEFEYIFCKDEPYELHFEWYLWEYNVKCGLTVYIDSDDTEWFILYDEGRKRIKRQVDKNNIKKSAKDFLTELSLVKKITPHKTVKTMLENNNLTQAYGIFFHYTTREGLTEIIKGKQIRLTRMDKIEFAPNEGERYCTHNYLIF